MAMHIPAKNPVIIENNGFRLVSKAIKRMSVYVSKEDITNTPVAPWKPLILASLRKFPELGDTAEVDLIAPKVLTKRPRVVIYFQAKPTTRHWFNIPEAAVRYMSIYIRYKLGFKMITPFDITSMLYKEELHEIE